MPIPELRAVFAKSRPWEIELGIAYWGSLHDRLAALDPGLPIQVIAGIFCALSPNSSDANNFEDTRRVLADGVDARVRTYGHSKRRALHILSGGSPHAILGQKTRSMWHNICTPDSPHFVTIDGHMYSIWHGRRVTMDKAHISHLLYEIISDGVKQEAHRARILPCAYQAIVWMTWKRLHRILYNPQWKLF